MKEIFMQRTIDHMHKLDPQLINDLSVKGAPTVVEEVDSEGNPLKYYKYETV